MTTPTNWPTPEQPGVPMFPNRDGKHVIDVDPDGQKNELVYYWKAEHQVWVSYDHEGPDDALEEYDLIGWAYVGPCLTPTQISDMLAGERERCANVCDTLKAREREIHGIGLSTTAVERTAKAYDSAGYLIRKLGEAR
ncbi:hypothetical protein FOH24_13765 [Acetobacter tropicalis]|uniref:Uncharacterized protein n=1 Tax=Acetobacter tropicalis TaxID=104102 RepID=A0A094ZEC9_9PROT|nr:hypothetical protein [Acetobacter tropicalis]KAA8387336.1 hypothetical protein FOH24_13765 [Acetobacter tropicalis]KAA8387551.1 hypothetical protein FOH22_09530 [Acetobacter tropicalis]KGB20981.1 hypothetical protein AtDm6_3346 [Acetobacter tropicalis]MBC9010125.1 hypothetical protein [Acetobacter tropicalis]MDO8170940.1 hypothetical protein [Acetobacter tropicalis]